MEEGPHPVRTSHQARTPGESDSLVRPTTRSSRNFRGAQRAAVTLLEALLASAILLITVLALTSAIAAGQAASLVSQKLFLGAMVIDDLLSELSGVPYDDLPDFDELVQNPGALETVDGAPYPQAYWPVGRRVEVLDVTIKESASGAIIRGRSVTVFAFDDTGELCSATLFIAEPAS